jgi:hypothetical protein
MLMPNEPRQKIMLDLGEGGCYILSMIHLAEDLHGGRRIDAVEKFLDLVQAGIVQENGFINEPTLVMKVLYGGRWAYRKEGPDYEPSSIEFEILRFERPTPKMIYSHFVLGDGTGRVKYDPLGSSKTVAEGRLISKRILHLVVGEEN